MGKSRKINPNKGPDPRAKQLEHYQDKIVNALRMGLFLEQACILAGISKHLFYQWCRRGNKDLVGPYKTFVDVINVALAEGEAHHVQNIFKHSVNDWRASAWFLDRRHPDRWGRREVNRFGLSENTETPEKAVDEMTEDEIRAELKQLTIEVQAELVNEKP